MGRQMPYTWHDHFLVANMVANKAHVKGCDTWQLDMLHVCSRSKHGRVRTWPIWISDGGDFGVWVDSFELGAELVI